jgi:hypothetical protein
MHLWRLIQSGSDLLNLTEFCTRDKVPPRRSKLSSKMTLARSKQMRITKEEIVAGHSAVQVRGLLRRFDSMFFTRSAVERVMRFKPEQAEKLINEMVLLELIEPTTPFDNQAAFEVAERGLALANATAAKPIYRRTAERVLGEFMGRVDAVNASKEYAFRIRGAVLFGSMLSCADRLGDVDVAIDLKPRFSDPIRRKQLCNRRRRLAQEQGRVFATGTSWALWPRNEVLIQLKACSRSLSLHVFDQLTQLENLSYRVLVGDANLIAAQIPAGRAV